MIKPGTILRLSDNTLVEVKKDPTYNCRHCIFSSLSPRGKLNPKGLPCNEMRKKYLNLLFGTLTVCMVPDGYSLQEVKGGV